MCTGPTIEPKHLPPGFGKLVPRIPVTGRPVHPARRRHHGGRGRAPADLEDAGPHPQQQNEGRGDPRHQLEDASQQAEGIRPAERLGGTASPTRPPASQRGLALRIGRSDLYNDRVAGASRCRMLVRFPRRSGGIGRRAWFRSMYPQGCGGSSPFFGTIRVLKKLRIPGAFSF